MLVFDALVSFQNLPQNDHNFLLRDSVWIFSYVICESAALEQLHHEVYVVLQDYYLEEADYIFVLGVLEFSQVTQCRYFAAQQISCDLVVDLEQVYRFYGDFLSGVSLYATQIDIACASFAEKCLIENGVGSVEMPWLMIVHILSNN